MLAPSEFRRRSAQISRYYCFGVMKPLEVLQENIRQEFKHISPKVSCKSDRKCIETGHPYNLAKLFAGNEEIDILEFFCSTASAKLGSMITNYGRAFVAVLARIAKARPTPGSWTGSHRQNHRLAGLPTMDGFNYGKDESQTTSVVFCANLYIFIINVCVSKIRRNMYCISAVKIFP